jgi:hypothetical protein
MSLKSGSLCLKGAITPSPRSQPWELFNFMFSPDEEARDPVVGLLAALLGTGRWHLFCIDHAGHSVGCHLEISFLRDLLSLVKTSA